MRRSLLCGVAILGAAVQAHAADMGEPFLRGSSVVVPPIHVRLVTLVKDAKDYELSPLGEVKVEGKSAVGVLVKSKGHQDVSLFFDKETGLLAKVEYRTTEPMSGKEISEERIVLKYGDKSKEGLAMPKEVLVKRDGETFMKAEVLESKVLEKLDDSEFKK